jgi:nucleoside-diphosphate-sugar epimerase
MNAIVTGAAGFVASHVVDAMLSRGDRVFAIDNLLTGSQENLRNALGHGNFRLLIADVAHDGDVIAAWLRGQAESYDAILHMASPASPQDYKKFPVETLAVNSYGTDLCCRLAALFDARLLYTSTSEVYGDPLEHPQREAHWGNVNPIGLRSCYDEGKRFGEAMVMAHVRAHAINARISLRRRLQVSRSRFMATESRRDRSVSWRTWCAASCWLRRTMKPAVA